VNGRWLNLFTGAVIWVLVMLSIILTAATVFPDLSGETILAVLGGGTALGPLGFAALSLAHRVRQAASAVRPADAAPEADLPRLMWRMPPLAALPAPTLALGTRVWMGVLRGYLVLAVLLVGYKVVLVALGN
jgi:hypothetical protein